MDGINILGDATNIASAAEIIEEARAGHMFILVDDESRENEGDLVIPAQFATPDAINFMTRYARGLVCLAMTSTRCEALGLPLMPRSNGTRLQTAFTVSIEAKDGVTTGISAADRSRTIGVAINPEMGKQDIVSPGHVFPLMAREGGTLTRAGHTEASVDVARLAGLTAAAAICEILNDNGTMARFPDLIIFAQRHNLKIGTIADLIAHRTRTEKLIRKTAQGTFIDRKGFAWQMLAYESIINDAEHLVLVKGQVSGEASVLASIHSGDIFGDVLDAPRSENLRDAMAQITASGSGIVVLMRESRHGAIREFVNNIYHKGEPHQPLRSYEIGFQILRDLGVRRIVLLSNDRRTVTGHEAYGIEIIQYRQIGNAGTAT